MKNSLFLMAAITLWLTFSCNPKGKPAGNYAKITILFPAHDTTSIKVFNYDLIDSHQNILAEIRPDSLGKGHIQPEIPGPAFYKLGFGDETFDIFLKPGDELTVGITRNGPETSVTFAGDESSVNGYLYKSGPMWEKINGQLNFHIDADENKFSHVCDSLKSVLVESQNAFFDTVALPENIRDALKIKYGSGLLLQKQIYKLIHQHDSVPENKIPTNLRDIYADMPLNAVYLDQLIVEYAMALNFFLRYKIHPSIWSGDRRKYFELREQLPVLAKQQISEASYPVGVKEFLQASNVAHWLADIGLTPVTDTIYNQFVTEYRNSAYLPAIREQYKEWVSISKGHPAPEITGISLEGDTIRLSDLKGKIVYIDVWATWCGPCKAEFPYSVSLQKEFEQNDEVAFLFVSIDSKPQDWKKYLKDENPPKGIHINEVKVKQHPTIHKSYKLWGIPRYILIDRDGNIVSPKAPRPSSDEIKVMISELVQNNQV